MIFVLLLLGGVSTAAYQIEGAWQARGRHIWDVFSHESGRCHNNDTGDIADDSYHRYEEDLDLIKDLGVTFYRFSISWSRIFPTKDATEPLKEGVEYYNNVINGLIKRNIKPFVTLYHWDLPEYLDWLKKDEICQQFTKYARKCFELFGDRVTNWLTFNEPWTYAVEGYGDVGNSAPGRCSDRGLCKEGNSSVEPYLVGHHTLIAHGLTYKLYNEEFREKQQGKIGITLNFDWTEPWTEKPEDIEASERNREFKISWFADPIHFGDYPQSMRTFVGERLPTFTDEESKLIQNSIDFFAMNHYTTQYAYFKDNKEEGWFNDQKIVSTYFDTKGKAIGERAESSWLYVVPWGFRKALNWVSERYDKPEIIITENGVDVPHEGTLPLPHVLMDEFRVSFLTRYLEELKKAKNIDGVNITGYFCWSALDNYEWSDGYEKRFGLTYIDRSNEELKRHKKMSFEFYREYIIINSEL